MSEETICPTCSYRGLDRARHKPGCPHKVTHGGLRTKPHGGRITGSVSPEHWALYEAFKGSRTPKEAVEALIDMALKPKKTRLKKD